MRHFLKKTRYFIFISPLVFLLLTLFNFLWITHSTSEFISSNSAEFVNYHHVLIPGAGNSPLGEWQNPTFSGRLNACIVLFSKIKIDRIVCSGKYKRPFYNEAADMREFLIKKGIPYKVIILENSSQSTFQSVSTYARRNTNDNVIIISQRMHLERAIYAAQALGLHARGFSAGNYAGNKKTFILYEALARMKLRIQLFWYFLTLN